MLMEAGDLLVFATELSDLAELSGTFLTGSLGPLFLLLLHEKESAIGCTSLVMY